MANGILAGLNPQLNGAGAKPFTLPVAPQTKAPPPPKLGNPFAGIGNFFSNAYAKGQQELHPTTAPVGVLAPSNGVKANSPGVLAKPTPNTLTAAQTSPVQKTVGGPQQQTEGGNAAPLGSVANPQAQGSNPSPVDPLGVTGAQAAAGLAAYGNGQPGLAPGSAPATGTTAPQAGGTTGTPTFGGLLGTLANTATNGTPGVQQAQNNLLQTQTNVQNAVGGVGTESVPLEFQQGRQALLSNLGTQQIANANQQVTNALTGQGQQLTGLSNATNAAAPSTASYGQTVFDPTTGTYKSSAGSNLDPQTTASNLADQVISGQISYTDAVSSLGYAGSAGQQFLNNAIQQKSPGFNTNQAQVNTQVQGTLAPQVSLAQGELQNLQATMATAPALQTTGIPAINAIGNFINSTLGNPGSQALEDARSAATSAVGTALATAYGGTPTSYDSLIGTWFPKNATPAQIQAGVQQFNSLIGYRAQAFGSPGTVSLNNGTNSNTSGTTNYNF